MVARPAGAAKPDDMAAAVDSIEVLRARRIVVGRASSAVLIRYASGKFQTRGVKLNGQFDVTLYYQVTLYYPTVLPELGRMITNHDFEQWLRMKSHAVVHVIVFVGAVVITSVACFGQGSRRRDTLECPVIVLAQGERKCRMLQPLGCPL